MIEVLPWSMVLQFGNQHKKRVVTASAFLFFIHLGEGRQMRSFNAPFLPRPPLLSPSPPHSQPPSTWPLPPKSNPPGKPDIIYYPPPPTSSDSVTPEGMSSGQLGLILGLVVGFMLLLLLLSLLLFWRLWQKLDDEGSESKKMNEMANIRHEVGTQGRPKSPPPLQPLTSPSPPPLPVMFVNSTFESISDREAALILPPSPMFVLPLPPEAHSGSYRSARETDTESFYSANPNSPSPGSGSFYSAISRRQSGSSHSSGQTTGLHRSRVAGTSSENRMGTAQPGEHFSDAFDDLMLATPPVFPTTSSPNDKDIGKSTMTEETRRVFLQAMTNSFNP